MPIQLSASEISVLYRKAFGRELVNPMELTDKEGEFLEDYISIYISNNLNNRDVINDYISKWLSE